MYNKKQMENIIEIKGIVLQKCPDCKEHLRKEHYYPVNWGTYGHKCKACAKKYYQSPKGKAILRHSQKLYRQKPGMREKLNKIAKQWRLNNPGRYNKTIYKWAKNNVDDYVDVQLKYQSKLPSGVYAIKYVDTVIYVGATKHPIRRINTHMSTIKTSSNITKINKLHSFLGYDKKDFTWEMIEECDPKDLFDKEKYYQKKLNSRANFKRIFGKLETTKSLVERLGLSTKPRNKWR